MLEIVVKVVWIMGLGLVARFLLRLLPRRIQAAVKTIATALVFALILNGNSFNLFSMTTIKLGIWAVGAFMVIRNVRLADVLAGKRAMVSLLGKNLCDLKVCAVLHRNTKVSFFSSYLRQTPVLLN